jgi:predicted Zn-dependent protease
VITGVCWRFAARKRYLGHMRWFILVLLIAGCGSSSTTLCKQFYKPYPNIVGERQRTKDNAPFVDAMGAYDRGDFQAASEQLGKVIERTPNNYAARMYLASALLATGEPYKAEMHLDFLERARTSGFNDQVDWYNALCWLCSAQYARALRQAQLIVAKPAHTYKAEATELVNLLNAH